jgi:hypothetical protein
MSNGFSLVREQLKTKLDSLISAQSFDVLLTGVREVTDTDLFKLLQQIAKDSGRT